MAVNLYWRGGFGLWVGGLVAVSVGAVPLPTVTIVRPDPNVTYGRQVPVQVEVKNFVLSHRWTLPGETEQAAVPGEGHLRYTLDNQILTATDATNLVLEDLPTSQHVLVVTLINHDHSVLPIETRVIFNVMAPRKGLTKRPLVGLQPNGL